MTGVQTCALPICFPVTIINREEEIERKKMNKEEEDKIKSEEEREKSREIEKRKELEKKVCYYEPRGRDREKEDE